jgi:Family of unknown function (DUF5681)
MTFKPGESGNLSGRPKQIITATELRKRLSDDMPEILETLIKMAKSGDAQAIKIILDRTHPPLKAQALPVSIPIDGTLADQGDNVIKATLTGQIPPDIGAALITALSNQSKLVEIDDLTKRIEALEDYKNGPN